MERMYKFKGHTPESKETRSKRPKKQAQQSSNKSKTKATTNHNQAQKPKANKQAYNKMDYLELMLQFNARRGQSFKLIEESQQQIVSIMDQATSTLSFRELLKKR